MDVATMARTTARGATTPGTATPGAGEQVRVIVTLKVPFQPEGELSPAAVQAQRAAIKAAQDGVLAELARAGAPATGVTRFESTPGMALTTTPAGVQVLNASALVESVAPDTISPPTKSGGAGGVSGPTRGAADPY
jgi:hypothetical protein